MEIQIRSISPERADDYIRFFDEIAFADHPEWGCTCYCCFFHATSEAEWNARTAADNRETARQMILSGRMSGLLAYVDDQPVGWCHFDRKDGLPGLAVFYPQVLDAQADAATNDTVATNDIDATNETAAIVCFTIAQGFRGQGLARRLLDAACRELASQNYRTVEAYPLLADTSEEGNYHGPLSMYRSHGFSQIRTAGNVAIMQKSLPGNR